MSPYPLIDTAEWPGSGKPPEPDITEKWKVDSPSKRYLSGVSGSPHRIPSLDGLRGISIWAVMLAHASSHFSGTPLHIRRVHEVLAPMAYFGVTTFFVISGFLITMLLLREHTRRSRVDLGRFYGRRAARILPAVLFYITIVLVFARVTFSQALYALTFTTTYFFENAAKPLQQLWSLSVEEQFYLLWPLAFSLGVRSAKRSCWVIMFVSPIIRFFLKHHGYAQYAHLAPAIADSLAAGCLLAFYENRVRAFARKYWLSTSAFLSLCVVTAGVAGMVYWWDAVLLWGLIPCLLALVISVAIERRDKVLNAGVLVWTGLLSYSLYLWQQPFLLFDGPLNYLSARILLTFALAYLSYRSIEQPLLKICARKRSDEHLADAVISAI
jgi:peptidoglycan/LPS O-acetylase OafA/YrhL